MAIYKLGNSTFEKLNETTFSNEDIDKWIEEQKKREQNE